jgi:heat shock protein HtpX
MKRIFLFLLTNLAVMIMLSVVWMVLSRFFGIGAIHVGGNVLSLGPLLFFCAIFGFGGAFISLALSKWMAKRSTGMHVIEQPRNELEQWLVSTVRRQAEQAGIKMPEVGIYDAPEINAFATGASRNSSLVAVSTGLLRAMTRDEAEAVLAHEVSHAANGDMVTLTLVQGVVNTFVMFFARIVGNLIDRVVFKNEEGPGIGYFVTVMVLEIVFGILASVVVMSFSRWREFRADAGGAQLAGRDKMIAALERLARTYGQSTLPSEVRAFGISGGVAGGLKKLFMSHPPLAERIQALRDLPMAPRSATIR